MKTIILSIIMVVAGVAAIVCKFWAIISFILYLVKDRPFDWISLWLMCGAILVTTVCYFVMLFSKNTRESVNKKFKSSFQERLEQMERQRKAMMNETKG